MSFFVFVFSLPFFPSCFPSHRKKREGGFVKEGKYNDVGIAKPVRDVSGLRPSIKQVEEVEGRL
jgi:hypothetical protein